MEGPWGKRAPGLLPGPKQGLAPTRALPSPSLSLSRGPPRSLPWRQEEAPHPGGPPSPSPPAEPGPGGLLPLSSGPEGLALQGPRCRQQESVRRGSLPGRAALPSFPSSCLWLGPSLGGRPGLRRAEGGRLPCLALAGLALAASLAAGGSAPSGEMGSPRRSLDLEAHGLALLAAKGDVVSGRAAASWALFTYEKSNQLKLLDSGAGGPDELAKRFQSGSVMYGLCRLQDGATGQQHIVLINWVGENVSDQRRQVCAGHLPSIRAFFKEANLVVKACRTEEVTQERLSRMMSLAAPSSRTPTKKGPPGDQEELVGTNYKKTNPALEILRTKRSSFWAQAEREEEERREEERRRAQEERRQWERQRMEEERRQAAERERHIQEKEQLIQEQRKLQAQREAEERRNEEARRQVSPSVSRARGAPTCARKWGIQQAPPLHL
ncbi:drebrin-like protein B [Sceloporus undulatus]|uniref:drebrin-like protein B n=1 Tax=Sceloporus undulatus TaxID=8520 RepID=UPI001C4C9209|nr:drebrin-like protein B [Sceloporus undulatus]